MSMVQRLISNGQLESLKISRRQLNTEWPDTIKARAQGENFRLLLPFPETFRNAFESMYSGNYHAREAHGGRLQIFLNGTESDDEIPGKASDWVEKVGQYVAIKDLLVMSFAIDYTHEGGNPSLPRSKIAEIRARAKPYEGAATKGHQTAAKELAAECISFLEVMSCYDDIDCVVAIPPSDPSKTFSLPKILAASIAEAREIADFSIYVSTSAKRESIKNVSLGEKLSALQGTIDVEADIFNDKIVLLVDDLYQSGITMNYCAQLLLNVGAVDVLGLACEKTCRNDDNT